MIIKGFICNVGWFVRMIVSHIKSSVNINQNISLFSTESHDWMTTDEHFY